MLFGDRLKRFRTLANMTQQELADKSGIERGHINRLERGKGNPLQTTVETLAKALNRTIAELLSDAPISVETPTPHVEVKDCCHAFRRTWAYRNLKNGTSMKMVELVGGWSDLTTLEGYVRRMTSEDALDSRKVKWV